MYFDRRLWAMTKGFRGAVALGVLLGLLALAAGIARFAFLGLLLSRVLHNEAVGTFLMPALATAGCIVVRAGLDAVRLGVAHRTAAAVQARLRMMLFDRIPALGPAWFAARRSGGVMLTVVDGVEQLQSFFGQYLPQLATALCAPFAIFAFMAWYDVPVASVLLAAALVALVAPSAIHGRDRDASLARSRAFKAFGEDLLDAIQGLPTLKAFGQSGAYAARLGERAWALSRNTFFVLAAGLATRGITDGAIALGAAGALVLGVHRVAAGEMTLTALLVVLLAGTEIFRPLRELRGVLHQGMLGQSAAAGVHALLGAGPDMPAGGVRPSGTAATVAFDGVEFAYPGARRAAHQALSFRIAAGERIGVVGPSGAGKSSIVRLLLRELDPQAGAVRIGGHDLRTTDPEWVRAQIAVVAQDSALFHGTVAENLRLGRPDATEAQMREAARDARAEAFIEALPRGYDTVIGERGLRLSGGQRQRIAIARALLRDAPILVLDEALSAVDAENEAEIQAALDRLMQGRTTLILAHRLSSVVGADRILVLDGGRIVQSGTHRALMAEGGLYRKLMGAQAEEAGAGGDLLQPEATAGAARERDAEVAATAAPELPLPQTIAALMAHIRPYRVSLLLTVLFGIGRVAAFIGVGALGALLLARLRDGGPTFWLSVALLGMAPVTGLLHWLESWLAHDMAYKLLATMRVALFAKLEALAPAYLLERRAGDLVALATQDVETVEYFYAHTVAPAVVAVLVPATVLGVLAAVDWRLALVLLPFLLWALLGPLLSRRAIDRLGAEAREALGLLGAQVTETVQGVSDLLAFGAVGRRRAVFAAAIERYRATRLRLLHDLSRQGVLLEVATSAGGLAIAVAGAGLVTVGSLDPALLPLLVLLSVSAFLPVSEIAQVGRQLADTFAATRRLRLVHDTPVRIVDGTAVPQPGARGAALRFEGVRFAYPGQARPALDGLDMAIPAGSQVALVGPSGAGKTTVAALLLRFWDPDAGRILLDGAPLPTLRLDALRERVALVAQDTYLFNDTLEANIRLARPDATHEQLHAAIRQAALTGFVASLPDGLATPVGERGTQLSGGQRQRIAIARAFLKDAPVLVLDEATSHLDAISEGEVRAALDGLMAHRTTLVIAHRLSTIRGADLILLLDHGKVQEAGTHASLLARGGAYARLVERQMTAGRNAAE